MTPYDRINDAAISLVQGAAADISSSLWSATSDVVHLGSRMPAAILNGTMAVYFMASMMVLAGAILTLRSRRRFGYSMTLSGVAVAVACFTSVMFWGTIVGNPTKEVREAYSYDGTRLTTVVSDDGAVLREDVVESQIVRADRVDLTDGTSFLILAFADGNVRKLVVDPNSIAALVRTLETMSAANAGYPI